MSGTAAQLTRARAAVAKKMIHRCDTARTVPATYDTAPDPVIHLVQQLCWYEETLATERDDEGGTRRVRRARILFPSGTDVTANDLITSVADQTGAQRLVVNTEGAVEPLAVDGDPVDSGGWIECNLVGVH